MAIADQLLELMFSWIKQRERCAEKLRKLAQELESHRENCNAAECVGNTVSVAGSLSLIGAGVATVFTGGAAAPLLGIAGAVCSGVGVTVSVGTKITEGFISSDTMKEAQKIEKKSNEIQEKINQLFKQLKAECSSTDPEEMDQHVMTEILKAMARRNGLEGHLMDFKKIFVPVKSNINYFSLEIKVALVTFFAFEVSGKICKYLFDKGAEQLTKEITKTGCKTSFKGGAMIVGGAVGLAFALPEAIASWTDLIKNNHVTEASQSLRDTAKAIEKTCQTLREQFDNIQKKLEEMDKRRQEEEEKAKKLSREKSTRHTWLILCFLVLLLSIWLGFIYQKDVINQTPPGTIKVGLLNVRSMNNKQSRILELITQNNLDVFLTTETWLRDNNADTVLREASPQNYTYHYQLRVGQRGGGVANQFRQELQGENIPFDSITTFGCVVTVLHHDEWNQPVPIINVYHPPGYNKDQFRTFLDEFQKVKRLFQQLQQHHCDRRFQYLGRSEKEVLHR
ncbi:uncharacterized protein LOC118323510 [Morone saxatilis]|uniref:uncharacterized protein LOC118323510 n=1 Tax=Morone saxatilis TaxID=34816 RepID=UPI0015E256F2|nr:uncharacterized protein LOC118323510 [Morone saxatilis]